jgi:5-formyltetrahydrofolate cyclo-ligase
MIEKPALRRQMLTALGAMTTMEKSTASQQICTRLPGWPGFKMATTIALFYPTATEPDLRPLLAISEKRFLFPKCQPGHHLSWHPPGHMNQWRPNRFGIMEPDPALDPAMDVREIALVLVPGLAFTACGARLGHGAGYYDRFLDALPPAVITAGICFSCQIPVQVPREAHDIKVHHLFHA